MKKIIVYWSGTGNTETIASMLKQDISADLYNVSNISVDEALKYDYIILGCPAMGAEELEEMEFKPFYSELILKANGKKIFLFGSYDWGDGEWMRLWEEDVLANGQVLGSNGLIVNGGTEAIKEDEYKAFVEEINK